MEPVAKLVRVYIHLSENVSSELSSTARLIRGGDRREILRRLREEIGEAVLAAQGRHVHGLDEKPLLRRFLDGERIAHSHAAVVLEASQVSYWYLVLRLGADRRSRRPGGRVHPDAVLAALKAGARSSPGPRTWAAAARIRASVGTVYGLIGRLMSRAGLPLDLFARLDLLEMMQKPYLERFVDGL
jgi:phosphoribosyl-ATP pyrophosphohydrolase